MAHLNRKTTPKVRDGKVQRKNRSGLTPNYWSTPQRDIVIDKEKPGAGFKHFLRKRDVVAFLGIVPEWPRLRQGLDAIVLATREYVTDGWYAHNVIGLCAWPKEQWIDASAWYHRAHKEVFGRLGVPVRQEGPDSFRCEFTPGTIRAYQLLHVFLHELGHHRDRMTTRSRARSARGEDYAEDYALEHEQVVWDRYLAAFGLID